MSLRTGRPVGHQLRGNISLITCAHVGPGSTRNNTFPGFMQVSAESEGTFASRDFCCGLLGSLDCLTRRSRPGKAITFFCSALLKCHVAEEQLEELFTCTHCWSKAVARAGSLQH